MINCTASEFQCNRTRTCISKRYVCDSAYECSDGSDEIGCRKLYSSLIIRRLSAFLIFIVKSIVLFFICPCYVFQLPGLLMVVMTMSSNASQADASLRTGSAMDRKTVKTARTKAHAVSIPQSHDLNIITGQNENYSHTFCWYFSAQNVQPGFLHL